MLIRFLLWLRRLLDPPRFCRTCGLEVCVGAVALYDTMTGAVKGYRWAVWCPKEDMSFSGPRHWRGNGFVGEHTDEMYLGRPPSWLADEVVMWIEAEASGSSYGQRTATEWLEAVREDVEHGQGGPDA